MKTAYLGIGSNVGDREAMLQSAIDQLHGPELRVIRVSSVYQTEPIGMRNQRCFLNLVAEIATGLFPLQLLARVAGIENRLGRKRLVPKGPRTIDIDVLFYGNSVVRTTALTIPHPRFAERRFVVVPMVELAPDLRDPVSRRTMRELLPGTLGQTVRKVEFRPTIPGSGL